MAYEVRFTPEAGRHLNSMPMKIRDAIVELIFGDLAENPTRVGKRLMDELTGLWSARRGPYRIVYEIDEERRLVIIHRAQHRGDVYRHR
jgi:mRNA interferase RelE/StbE